MSGSILLAMSADERDPGRPDGPGRPGLAERSGRPGLEALLVVAIAIASWIWIDAAERAPTDRSDEPEWVAISIAHTRQLFLGEEPPGTDAQRAAGQLPENPWRRGVQGTTFGAANPCLPKLVWGLVALAGGHPNAPATVFQKFHRQNPKVAQRAWSATAPAMPALRRVVVLLVALSALLLFAAARLVAGRIAGVAAWAAWCSSPLIQTWSHYLRPDFFMVAFALATLVAALAAAPAILGRRGAARQVLALGLLGLLAGLAVASKLNGAAACFFVAAAVPLAVLVGRNGSLRPGPLIGGLALAGLATLALLYTLNPVLWSDPLGEGREILAFWSQHMRFQAERWEALGGRAASNAGERFALFWDRAILRDEPLRATLGVPGGALVAALGVVALALRSLGRPIVSAASGGHEDRGPLDRARSSILLSWILVTSFVTTLWLPLDWDRYYFVYVAGLALAEAACVGAIARFCARRMRGMRAARAG